MCSLLSGYALCPVCDEWHVEGICSECGVGLENCHDDYWCKSCEDCCYEDGVDCDICGEGMFHPSCIHVCAECDQYVCDECLCECANGGFFCEDDFGECDHCGNGFCWDCLGECTNGGFFCENDFFICEECGNGFCWECMGECSTCGGFYCVEDFGECDHCGNGFCWDCLGECTNGGFFCENDFFYCTTCGNGFCEDCIYECSSCSETICEDCIVGECEVCGMSLCENCGTLECNNGCIVCESCLLECVECGGGYCENCMIECNNCGEWVCFDCAEECTVCGVLLCKNADCSPECSTCSARSCNDDFFECSECGNGYCESCICSECGVALEDGCHDYYTCSVCGECAHDNMCLEGGDHCQDCCLICAECGSCALAQDIEICDNCNICENCREEYHCVECGACKADVDCCDEHGELICLDCALSDGYHCPECETCYESVPQCNEGGEHCQDCCILCAECGECSIANSVDFCGYCDYCENCWKITHCHSCGECSENIECCDKHLDFICVECAADENLHCPDCHACYEDVNKCIYGNEHCSECCLCDNSGIDINEENFPDASFRSYITKFDVSGDNKLSEAEIKKATDMKITNSTVKSLQGIDNFVYLKSLIVLNSTIEDLEGAWLSDKLETLYLQLSKSIETIDLSNLTHLEVLSLSSGGLKELNVAMLANLKKLNCSDNAITSLDLKNMTALVYLNCSGNELCGLDFSTLSASLDVYSENNVRNVASLPCGFLFSAIEPTIDDANVFDVDGATWNESEGRWIVGESVTSITYKYKTNGKNVVWYNDSTFTLKIGEVTHGWSGSCDAKCSCGKESCSHTHFTNGVCDKCGAVKVDETTFPDAVLREYVSSNFDDDSNGMLCTSECESVTSLSFTKAQGIHNLKGIEHFMYLKTLSLVDTITTPVDLQANTSLQTLKYVAGYKSDLNLKNNCKLQTINIVGAQITTKKVTSKMGLTGIDLSSCSSLTSVTLTDNLLESLSLNASQSVTTLLCSGNNLKTLNLGDNLKLKSLKAANNQLMALDLKSYTKLAMVDLSDNVREFDSIPNAFLFCQLNSVADDANVYDTEEFSFDVDINRWHIEDSTATYITYKYDDQNDNVEDVTYTVKFATVYDVLNYNAVDDVYSDDSHVVVYTGALTIYVKDATEDVTVYNIQGQMIDKIASKGLEKVSIKVPSVGVYVVKSGSFAQRVIVKD